MLGGQQVSINFSGRIFTPRRQRLLLEAIIIELIVAAVVAGSIWGLSFLAGIATSLHGASSLIAVILLLILLAVDGRRIWTIREENGNPEARAFAIQRLGFVGFIALLSLLVVAVWHIVIGMASSPILWERPAVVLPGLVVFTVAALINTGVLMIAYSHELFAWYRR